MSGRLTRSAAVLALLAFGGSAMARDGAGLPPAARQLQQAYPGVQVHEDQGRIRIFYGAPMNGAATPELAAAQWVAQHGEAFGAGALSVGERWQTSLRDGRFTAFAYQQYIDGMPVEYGNLRVLVLNAPLPRVVYAAGTLAARPAGGFPEAAFTGAQAVQAVRNMIQFNDLSAWSVPEAVIYQGETDPIAARRAWKFVGEVPGIATNRRLTFFVDMSTGVLLSVRNEVIDTDVTGTVKGMASPGTQADHAGNPPQALAIPEVLMSVQGGNSAFSLRDGNFTIPHPGVTPVTITSNVSAGRWVDVNPQGGVPEVTVAEPNTPGTPAAPMFNANPGGANSVTTAQINALIHTDLIHNYYRDRAPGFTGISIKIPANTGVSGTCNAFFNGSSINFYNAGGSCNNTAFSTVIAHEYGHWVVNRLGLSQGAFGEGFSDVSAMLLYDKGVVGEFFTTSGGFVRSPSTANQQYPCSSGAIHTCGQILGGVWWKIRTNFGSHFGSEPGLNQARDLQVAWSLITTGGSGLNSAHPATAIEVLTVDDNDGNLANGTPNYSRICAAFSGHGIQCPPISILAFEYPNGRPEVLTPGQPTTIRVNVTGVSGTPVPNTGTVTFRVNSGSFQTAPMTQIATNQYEATIPATACLDSVSYYFTAQSVGSGAVTDPQNAPTSTFGALSASNQTAVADLNFETNPGWTVTNDPSLTTGAWERVIPHTPPSTNCPPADFDGSGRCFVTDNRSGNFDVDGGPTVLTTTTYDLSGFGAARLSYARWIVSTNGNPDPLLVQVSNNNGQTWTTVETATSTSGWVVREWNLGSILPLTAQYRVRFSVSDNPNDSLTEAGIDRFKVIGFSCAAPCYADCNGDGQLNLADFGCFQTKFATGDPYADCNGDGQLNLADFGCFQTRFAVGCP